MKILRLFAVFMLVFTVVQAQEEGSGAIPQADTSSATPTTTPSSPTASPTSSPTASPTSSPPLLSTIEGSGMSTSADVTTKPESTSQSDFTSNTKTTDAVLSPDESVNIDVTMTYSNQFNDSLLDPESSYYKKFSKQATDDFTTIIQSTLTLTVRDETLVWSFSKGSTIATSKNVTVVGTNDVADAQQQIAESIANVPTNITNIAVQDSEPTVEVTDASNTLSGGDIAAIVILVPLAVFCLLYSIFLISRSYTKDYKGTTGSDLYSATNHSATYNRDSDNSVNLTPIDGGGYHNMKPPEVSTPQNKTDDLYGSVGDESASSAATSELPRQSAYGGDLGMQGFSTFKGPSSSRSTTKLSVPEKMLKQATSNTYKGFVNEEDDC